MNLLIVEDESRLRNSIANNIAWEERGIDICGLAANGPEALALIGERRPDMMLLDIKMPGMDGLTLAEKALELEPSMKIIVLSGHDDFAYAQRAIDLGVMKYLLKPAGEEEIVKAVDEAAALIRAEWELWHRQEVMDKRWKENLPVLQYAFFQQWVDGRLAGWEMERRSREVGVRLPEGARYLAAIADVDALSEQETRFGEDDVALLQFSLHSIALELLASPRCTVFQNESRQTALLFIAEQAEGGELLYTRANMEAGKLLGAFRDCMKVTASVAIGRVVDASERVSVSYMQAQYALQERVALGKHIIIPYLEREGGSVAAVAPRPALEKALETGMETGDLMKAEAALAELLAAGVVPAASKEALREAQLQLIGLFVRFVQRQGWSLHEVLQADAVYLHEPGQLGSKEQIAHYFDRVTDRIVRYVHETRRTNAQQLLGKAIALIDGELQADLTLQTVADRLFVNASYLSRIFKKETGRSFTSYLLERKMERARELLNGGMKVYHVAEQLGYAEASYFIRIFSKYWGTTPGEMKK